MPPPPLLMTPRMRGPPVQLGKECQGIGIIHGGQVAHESPGAGTPGGDPQKTGDLPVNAVGSRLARTFSVGMDVWAKLFQYRTGMELPR